MANQLDEVTLRSLDSHVSDMLIERAEELGFDLPRMTRFQYTPDKGYLARRGAEFLCPDGSFKKATVVLFQPGDGTGNRADMTIYGIPAHETPRKKSESDFAELFMSLGTLVRRQEGDTMRSYWLRSMTSLHEMGLTEDESDTEVIRELTLPTSIYMEALESMKLLRADGMPRFALTLDRGQRGKSLVGDPHAIISPIFLHDYLARMEVYQVGAFMPLGEEDPYLDKVLEVVANQPSAV